MKYLFLVFAFLVCLAGLLILSPAVFISEIFEKSGDFNESL